MKSTLTERLARFIDPEAFATEDEDTDPDGTDYAGYPFSERRKDARVVSAEILAYIKQTHTIQERGATDAPVIC